LFAVTLLLSVGGHLLMLEAVSESTQRIPLGSALTTDQGLMELVNQGASPPDTRSDRPSQPWA
jgi:flagellar biosynthesis protein FliR